MKRILVAGATGYLGQFAVKALKAKGYWIRALGRSAEKLAPVEGYADELYIGEVTDEKTISMPSQRPARESGSVTSPMNSSSACSSTGASFDALRPSARIQHPFAFNALTTN